MIDDTAFFLTEQEALKNEIKKLEDDRKKILSISNDWKDTANDIFMFARYAKEDFDSDDWERKRSVIQRLGADLKLSNRTIQFTPVKYLVPVAKKYPELKQQFELARTDSQQMKKGLKEDLISLVVHPEGLEPTTLCSEDRCSNPLSYGCKFLRTSHSKTKRHYGCNPFIIPQIMLKLDKGEK